MTTRPPERTLLPGPLIVVLVLLGISVFINYIDRGNLSIAAPLLEHELKIDPARLGILLSAFFWTYALLQPVYGWLVDRLNVYWLFAGCFGLWSIATAATSLVHTFAALLALRLFVGIGEAVAFPSYSKMIALNYPEEHRGVANSSLAIGLSVGPGFGILMGGMLMARFGWRPFFLVLGLGSLMWLPFWIKWMPQKNIVPASNTNSSPSLWEFIRLRSAWGSCIGLFAANYVNYFLLTWLPYYLVRERHFSMDQMAKIGAVGYLTSATSASVTGWFSDHLIRKGGAPTFVRKLFCGGGMAMCGGLLCVSAFIPSAGLSVGVFIFAMVFYGMCAANMWAISQTLAGPQAAGRWVGFQNCFGNMAGIVVPMLTGFALRRTGHFRLPFAFVAAVALIGCFAWTRIIGRVEQVRWKGRGEVEQAAAA